MIQEIRILVFLVRRRFEKREFSPDYAANGFRKLRNECMSNAADIVSNDMDLSLDINIFRHQFVQILRHDHFGVSLLGMRRFCCTALIQNDDMMANIKQWRDPITSKSPPFRTSLTERIRRPC